MIEKIHETRCGNIHYYISKIGNDTRPALIFLPGLTADHRLFDKQIETFEGRYTVFTWDAPAHNVSWPFTFDFDLFDKANWLHEILEKEEISKPLFIGQSMGGYVSQVYTELYPEEMAGFISIDSAPLQREYVSDAELWLLKRMEPVYSKYPWKSLLRAGSKGVATTEYGQKLMYEMMNTYDQARYAKIAGHGYIMLAEAMEKDLPYAFRCPVMLIAGKKDHSGSCIAYNKKWEKKTGYEMYWIENAGHNSNTDRPDEINSLILKMIDRVTNR